MLGSTVRAKVPRVASLAACPHARYQRPYPEPGAEAVLAHLGSLRERVKTLNAETLSDARIGKERANVTVMILAAWGGKLRYQACNDRECLAPQTLDVALQVNVTR